MKENQQSQQIRKERTLKQENEVDDYLGKVSFSFYCKEDMQRITNSRQERCPLGHRNKNEDVEKKAKIVLKDYLRSGIERSRKSRRSLKNNKCSPCWRQDKTA